MAGLDKDWRSAVSTVATRRAFAGLRGPPVTPSAVARCSGSPRHQDIERAEGKCLLVSGGGYQDLREERPVGLRGLSIALAGEPAGNPV